jgi:hypothetical protein
MMVDIQTISIAVASAGVFAAAIYYIFQIRHQTRIRQTDLVIRLYSAINNREFSEAWEKFRDREIKSMEDYKEKYGAVEFNQVMSVYTEVGVLLRRKLIDIDIVLDLFGDSVQRINEKIKHLDRMTYENEQFEYLYNEVKKREQKLQQKGVKNG